MIKLVGRRRRPSGAPCDDDVRSRIGVDLGQLLSVILRNVPPRPSSYAQRAGRAGRREKRVALIVTFAGSGLPHDAYYYAQPVEMIRGAIRPVLVENSAAGLT